MKKSFFILTAIFFCFAAKAQIEAPVKWAYGSKNTGSNNVVLLLKASVEDKWHIYALDTDNKNPVATTISFAQSKDYGLAGNLEQPTPVKKYEAALKTDVRYFEHSVIFQQKIKLRSAAPVVVKGTIEYMACNDRTCMPREDVNFAVRLGGVPAVR